MPRCVRPQIVLRDQTLMAPAAGSLPAQQRADLGRTRSDSGAAASDGAAQRRETNHKKGGRQASKKGLLSLGPPREYDHRHGRLC